jgi:hypothetical protein
VPDDKFTGPMGGNLRGRPRGETVPPRPFRDESDQPAEYLNDYRRSPESIAELQEAGKRMRNAIAASIRVTISGFDDVLDENFKTADPASREVKARIDRLVTGVAHIARVYRRDVLRL